MIRHILKIIWAQRKVNSWIFAELLVVACAVWWMTDRFYVDMRTYYSPMGYDIQDCWRFELDHLSPAAPGYLPESERTLSAAEELTHLRDRITLRPEVENACISFYSAPYSFGNSWTGIEPVDGDTTARSSSYQVRRVSPEFFDMFRIYDLQGGSITAALASVHAPIVVSKDMALKFFHSEDVRGRQLTYRESEERMTISAVSVPFRNTEYERSEPFFYGVLSGTALTDFFTNVSTKHAELCVRMNRRLTQEEMNTFLTDMGDLLTVGNLYVYNASSIASAKESHLRDTNNAHRRNLSMMLFLLLNVLFGIIGTFWLRGQARRGEIGLRVALGADRSNVRAFMYREGLLLLFLTVPFALAFALNMIIFDMPDSYRLPYTAARLLVTFGTTYVIMATMICIGISFPVRKAGKIAPAEALHYE